MNAPQIEIGTLPLLLTKLHRPPITPDLLPRSQLLERLDQGRQRPLTLISAPAGYGKSILASSWLESCECPSVWVSLDEYDNDLMVFLNYFIAAVQSVFPDADLVTQSMLKAPSTPLPLVLARSLANDLEKLESDFIVVLDDYHHIHETAVHELLSELLRYPPRSMHLLIASRGDPPFNLAGMRAKRQLTEIRLVELSFTLAETSAFFIDVMGIPMDQTAASRLRELTEGWVTALRLAALSLRHRENTDVLLSGLRGDSRYMQDYLAAEVMSHQPPEIHAWMLRTSILDRFCAQLCEALCQGDGKSAAISLSGQEFLRWLEDAGLFLVSLDGRGEWFRFHHLFQQILRDRLKCQASSNEVTALHSRAAAWFAKNDLIDEALQHAIIANDIPFAVKLVEQHRNHLMNTEQWDRLDRWLQRLPAETVERNPRLLVTKAWSGLMYHSKWSDSSTDPDKIAELLSISCKSPENTMISGEINALRATLSYSAGDVDDAIPTAEKALRTLHPDANSMRGQTALILAMALQGVGNLDGALKIINDTLHSPSSSSGVLRSKMLTGLCVVRWLEANIPGMKQPALQLLKFGEASNLPESAYLGRYFLGSLHYIRDELSEAESHFAAVVANRYMTRSHYFAQCSFGLALCYCARGRTDQARQVTQSVIDFTMETDNAWLLQLTRAFEADLALRQGRIAEAVHGAQNAFPGLLAAMYVFYVPQLTAAKALLARNTSASRKEAADLLDHLKAIVVSTHNARVRIDVLALQALLHDAQGNEPSAFEKLTQSLALAEPGGFVRNFVDLGTKMAGLLKRLSLQCVPEKNKVSPYVARILAAFPEQPVSTAPELTPARPGHPPATPTWVESLTKRELETLRFLATDLSPQEIAAEMFVSTATVRSHTKRIYSKLNVHSRFEAVQRAKELGLL